MKRNSKFLFFWMYVALLLGTGISYAESVEPADENAHGEKSVDNDDSFKLSSLWLWPFEHVIQPALNGLIFPIAKPIDYAVKNGIVEKSLELISIGDDYKIMVYPSFNFKPGSETMIGANYRHRGIFLEKDYLVLQGEYFANGDMGFTARYTKHALFGSRFFGGLRYDIDLDRDFSVVVPQTKQKYLQPDSSFSVVGRLGAPLFNQTNWNAELWASVEGIRSSLPDVDDTLLIGADFPIEDRGVYQHHWEFPVGASIVYDNLDFAYAPSRGNRLVMNASYVNVGKYDGVKAIDLNADFLDVLPEKIEDGGKNHDYVKTELIFQHYFYLGKAEQYILSATEARQNRRFYTDFSWDEVVRIWRPEQVMNTLFERRVIAMQFRLVDIWEMEKGGAPYNAFVSVNGRTPLRGYGDKWTTQHLMSLSTEYRWPVDRFVDGVLFDEYALLAPEFDKWSFSHFYNSWGFGIRVRQPNLYLFRLQFGFHGLQGVNMLLTIAPEFK